MFEDGSVAYRGFGNEAVRFRDKDMHLGVESLTDSKAGWWVWCPLAWRLAVLRDLPKDLNSRSNALPEALNPKPRNP